MLLLADLLQQVLTYRTHTYDKKIEHLRLGEEERIMYDVERFAQAAKCNYKRYIGFRSPLRTSYHVDTVAPQNVEQFSGNTGRMLHILAHNSYGGKIFLGFDRTDCSDSHIVAELFAQYFHRQLGIGIAHGKCRIVFGRCLRHQKDTDTRLCQPVEYT